MLFFPPNREFAPVKIRLKKKFKPGNLTDIDVHSSFRHESNSALRVRRLVRVEVVDVRSIFIHFEVSNHTIALWMTHARNPCSVMSTTPSRTKNYTTNLTVSHLYRVESTWLQILKKLAQNVQFNRHLSWFHHRHDVSNSRLSQYATLQHTFESCSIYRVFLLVLSPLSAGLASNVFSK